MAAHCSRIAINDENPAIRQPVGRLCGAAASPSRGFPTAEEILAADAPGGTSFLILGNQLPGFSGFELHQYFMKCGIRLPQGFIPSQAQPLNRKKPIKKGTAAYLTKPFPGTDLIAAESGQFPDLTESPTTNIP